MSFPRLHKIIRGVWVIWGVFAIVWLVNSYQAQGFDTAVLQSDASVTVTEDFTTIRFIPTGNVMSTGLAFYPGGMVDPHAYAPMAHTIAEQGYAVVLVKLPWRMTFFTFQETAVTDQTLQLFQEQDEIAQWVFTGHSRGGALATRFAKSHADTLAGLILIGTSHPKETAVDLSALTLPLMKIVATEDEVAGLAQTEANRVYLPAQTEWLKIEGGNHAQFAYYGSQLGDGDATISREMQQILLVEAILDFLSSVKR